MKMTKTILARIWWLGRGTATVMGLAVMLAIALGVGTTALAAVPGDPLRVGQANDINALTRVVGSTNQALLKIDNDSKGANATALDLRVEPGKPPMTVNSAGKVITLNADRVDGKSAGEIGVNGLEVISSDSASNSISPKNVSASCPAGKVLVGAGHNIVGAKSGIFPNAETNAVVDEVSMDPMDPSFVYVEAVEEEPISDNWSVTATAICATAP